MFGSEILDVVIGLVFVYVLFSLICTTLTEGISRMFAMRSGTLESAIRNMIQGRRVADNHADSEAPAAIDDFVLDVKALYTSARLHSLAKASRFHRLRFSFGPADKRWRASRPSYIPSRSFALALFDTLLEANGADPAEPEVSDTELQAQIEAVKSAVETVMPEGMDLREQMVALLDSQDTASMALQTKAQTTFKQLKETIGNIQPEDSYLRKALESIVSNAEQEAQDFDEAMAKMRIGVEEWFDDSMDRVSGWYTRNTRTVVVGFAIIVTVMFNIDTLAIADALQVEPLLREAIVEQAIAFAGAQQESSDDAEGAGPPAKSISDLQDEIDQLGVPVGWVVIIPKEMVSWQKYETQDAAKRAAALLGSSVYSMALIFATELDENEGEHASEIEKARRYRQEWPRSPSDAGRKIAGLFVTIVALSLGAPFWFDALNKLVNLRAVGKAPGRADAVDASISVNAPDG